MPRLRHFLRRDSVLFILLNLIRSLIRVVMSHLVKPPAEEPALKPQSPAADPTEFDPLVPSVPVSYPIKTLESLSSRSFFSSFHFPFNRASVALRQESPNLPDRPRVLVCHDMQGGYGDDRWVQGGTNGGAYSIWHWYLMDIFVYFSHDLVTVPPPCWTNTAHRHGVRVLGTFITEWDEGRHTCDKLLSTKESAELHAERLTELAVELGFDGWLINMEIKLNREQIPNMLHFVSHLTQTMHSSKPGSLVIWYDSVTTDGHLDWQDQLNHKNKPFFDICDGIFMNYTWKENYPRLSAAVAGDRKYDVYMGIDVFGRGSYGGGEWNINVALDLLKKEDVSAAIFAPGWVYQTNQQPDFMTAQNQWWAIVEKSWGVQQKYPKSLPFYTNFDQGRGYHYSVDGENVSSASWCNLSCQGFQPFLEVKANGAFDSIEVLVDLEGASYSGGGNITFRGTLKDNDYFSARLLEGDLILGKCPVHFTFSAKSEANSLVGLSLEFSSTSDRQTALLLTSNDNVLGSMNRFSATFDKVIAPLRVTVPARAPEWAIAEGSIKMSGYTLRRINAICYRSIQRNSESDSAYKFNAVLGHISIKHSESGSHLPPSNSWLVEAKQVKWSSRSSDGLRSLSVLITWRVREGCDAQASGFESFNIYVEREEEVESGSSRATREFLGVALVGAFYVSDLVVPADISSLRFIVQVCGDDGICLSLEESPWLSLGC